MLLLRVTSVARADCLTTAVTTFVQISLSIVSGMPKKVLKQTKKSKASPNRERREACALLPRKTQLQEGAVCAAWLADLQGQPLQSYVLDILSLQGPGVGQASPSKPL